MTKRTYTQEVSIVELLVDTDTETVSYISSQHELSLTYSSQIVSLNDLFGEITSKIDTREIIAVHHPGTPGTLTVGIMGEGGGAIHGLDMDLDLQVKLPRQDSDAHYRVTIKSHSEMEIHDPAAFDEQDQTEDYPIYDTIDMTYCTPVQLIDEVAEDLKLADGIDYLRRKMHHQYNGETVEPKKWFDIVMDLREGELNTSGMIKNQDN